VAVVAVVAKWSLLYAVPDALIRLCCMLSAVFVSDTILIIDQYRVKKWTRDS